MDSTLSPWDFSKHCLDTWDTAGWSIFKDQNEAQIRVSTPIKSAFEVPQSVSDWAALVDGISEKGPMLWALSLYYVPMIHNIDAEVARMAVSTFYEYLPSAESKLEDFLVGSWDHCIAMRLRTLSALYSAGESEQTLSRNYIDVELRLANAWAKVLPNNHGLMLVEGLLHAAIIRRDYDLAAAEKDIARASEEIDKIIGLVFGSDYWCNENSTFYHHFYIHKLSIMCRDLKNVAGLQSLVAGVEAHISKMKTVMSYLTYPSGIMPGMGDSTPIASNYGSTPGTHFSERTGLWIKKDDQSFISFKCGYAATTHKHADDTSIVFQFDGEDFLIDSGTANYNYSDPRILMLRTQRGHSGIYFERFDGTHPVNLYRGHLSCIAKSFAHGDNRVWGSYSIAGKFFASRTLQILNNRHFKVTDWAGSVDGEQFVHRFIVPPEIRIDLTESSLKLSGAKNELVISFSTPLKGTVFKEGSGENLKGWVSRKANEVEPAICIDLLIKNRSTNTVIFDCVVRPIS